MLENRNKAPFPWREFASELVGTALLVLVGLSLVILMFGTGTPMARLIPDEGLRRLPEPENGGARRFALRAPRA